MKIVLETTDLLAILGLHLGRTLSPEQVIVRTEPDLQIEIDGAVAVGELAARRETRSPAMYDNTEVVYDEPVPRKAEKTPDDGMSMRDLLAYSRQIEDGIQAMPRR